MEGHRAAYVKKSPGQSRVAELADESTGSALTWGNTKSFNQDDAGTGA